jgi:hypothetical protein
MHKQKVIQLMMKNNMEDNKDLKKEWFDENQSHGAFALTQEEIDFYYNKEYLKERFGDKWQ